jgi:hypothetical protein
MTVVDSNSADPADPEGWSIVPGCLVCAGFGTRLCRVLPQLCRVLIIQCYRVLFRVGTIVPGGSYCAGFCLSYAIEW